MVDERGPLQGLAGEWESDEGDLDTAFSHAKGRALGTPYRERCSMKPFEPVDNGSQHFYGLDYRTAVWRGDEEFPFHTEVGYWLWDSATGQVTKGEDRCDPVQGAHLAIFPGSDGDRPRPLRVRRSLHPQRVQADR
jgi:hypothetical protein